MTEALYAAGYNSPSRLSSENPLGIPPARFRRGGEGEQIGFTSAPTPFGCILVGATPHGLCWLALAATKEQAESSLRAEFPLATLTPAPALASWIDRALASLHGQPGLGYTLGLKEVGSTPEAASPCLDLRGTQFQLRVWRELTRIQPGQTLTYSQLAAQLGQPTATRAVARACALNRVSLLVPCHRIIGASGSLTGYRWGVERKRSLLEAEQKESNP